MMGKNHQAKIERQPLVQTRWENKPPGNRRVLYALKARVRQTGWGVQRQEICPPSGPCWGGRSETPGPGWNKRFQTGSSRVPGSTCNSPLGISTFGPGLIMVPERLGHVKFLKPPASAKAQVPGKVRLFQSLAGECSNKSAGPFYKRGFMGHRGLH